MKKIALIVLALVLCLSAVAGCNKPKDTIEGATSDVIDSVISGSGIDFGALMSSEVTSDNCVDLTGLTAEQFAANIESATASTAMINVNAHLVVVLKAKDAAAATTAKDLIAKGFNSLRWICVTPDKSLVVESGSYILLVASNTEAADGIVKGFKALAGDNIGSVNTFFTAEQ